MTVKDFIEKATGVDDYTIEGKNIFFSFHPCEKDDAIKKYGDKKIVSIYFYVDSCDDRCCDIEVE